MEKKGKEQPIIIPISAEVKARLLERKAERLSKEILAKNFYTCKKEA